MPCRMFKYTFILIVTVSCFFSCSESLNNKRLFKLFKVNPLVSSTDDWGYPYEYLAKVENHHKKPIVVPYIQHRLLPNLQKINVEVEGDSLVNFDWGSTADYIYFGMDTLHPKETQRYHVDLTEMDLPKELNSYKIITLSCYYLDSFTEDSWNNNPLREWFIIHRDSLGGINIYTPPHDFNPYEDERLAIPN